MTLGAQGLVGLSPQGLVGLGAQRLVGFGRFLNLEVISDLLPYSRDCYVIRNTKVSGLKKRERMSKEAKISRGTVEW